MLVTVALIHTIYPFKPRLGGNATAWHSGGEDVCLSLSHSQAGKAGSQAWGPEAGPRLGWCRLKEARTWRPQSVDDSGWGCISSGLAGDGWGRPVQDRRLQQVRRVP